MHAVLGSSSQCTGSFSRYGRITSAAVRALSVADSFHGAGWEGDGPDRVVRGRSDSEERACLRNRA